MATGHSPASLEFFAMFKSRGSILYSGTILETFSVIIQIFLKWSGLCSGAAGFETQPGHIINNLTDVFSVFSWGMILLFFNDTAWRVVRNYF
jgi:hypothetical protein